MCQDFSQIKYSIVLGTDIVWLLKIRHFMRPSPNWQLGVVYNFKIWSFNKYIFLNENIWFSKKNVLKSGAKCQIGNTSVLVQIMARSLTGDKLSARLMTTNISDVL